MMREVHRTAAAFSGGGAGLAGTTGPPISKLRAGVQIVLTVVLVPICLWALFGSADQTGAARSAASALLGAIVTFWLKD
jgi:hypothetical protein